MFENLYYWPFINVCETLAEIQKQQQSSLPFLQHYVLLEIWNITDYQLSVSVETLCISTKNDDGVILATCSLTSGEYHLWV